MIDINDTTFRYKGQREPLYQHFALELEEGRIYGLLGKNGTGKSTLLYLMAGLLRPQQGSVRVDGMEASKRRVEMLREVFIVPEEFSLPDTTLEAYIKMNRPFYPHFSREVLEQCLGDFDLSTDLHLRKLSMGQKKKVYMSFALAAGTRVLLMDEPTNGLDIPSKSQFRKVVARCMTDSRTIVISTHQVHDVEALLDHIVILDNGRVALDASTADVCQRYTFATCHPGEALPHTLYAEHALQGDRVVALRQAGGDEAALDLELLFNAVAAGALPTGAKAALPDDRKEDGHES